MTRERGWAWMEQAACRGMDTTAIFYPTGDHRVADEAAKQVCAGCPVRDRCADWADKESEQFGTWGGLTDRERGNVPYFPVGPRTRLPRHGTISAYNRHRYIREKPCRACMDEANRVKRERRTQGVA